MTESDSAILNSVVVEEEGEGEEGSSAPASKQQTLGMQQARRFTILARSSPVLPFHCCKCFSLWRVLAHALTSHVSGNLLGSL